jgi:PAS domain S-box-containing protein
MKHLIEPNFENINIEDLKESLSRLDGYRKAIDQTIMHFISNVDGQIKYVNDSLCSITGYTELELLGNDVSIIESNFFSKKKLDQIKQQLINGQVWEGNFKNRKKNGEFYWVRSTIIPIKDKTNTKTIEFFYIQNEITEHIESEQEKIDLIIFSQEKDKEEMSNNLHEGIAQVLYGLTFKLKNFEESLNLCQDQVLSNEIKDIQEYVKRTTTDVINLASDIMPRLLMSRGLEASLESYFNNCSIEINHSLLLKKGVSKSIEITMYRAIVTIIEELAQSRIVNEVYINLNDNYDFNCQFIFLGGENIDKTKFDLIKSRIHLVGGNLSGEKKNGKCVIDISFEPRIAFNK